MFVGPEHCFTHTFLGYFIKCLLPDLLHINRSIVSVVLTRTGTILDFSADATQR